MALGTTIAGSPGDHFHEVRLASAIAANGVTDHGEICFGSNRIYIVVVNGATNSVVFGVDGSHDGTNWFALGIARSATEDYAVTDLTTTAGVAEVAFLNPQQTPRYVRVDVTTANAVGSAFYLYSDAARS